MMASRNRRSTQRKFITKNQCIVVVLVIAFTATFIISSEWKDLSKFLYGSSAQNLKNSELEKVEKKIPKNLSINVIDSANEQKPTLADRNATKIMNNKNVKTKESMKPSKKNGLITNRFEAVNKHIVSNSLNVPKIYPISRASQVVKPLWLCKERRTVNSKFVFVHIFKTAGSTMRTLFRYYSHYCQMTWGLVVSCSGLTLDSMKEGIWRKKNGKCIFKKGVARSGDEFVPSSTSINTTYIEKNLDLLGGHLPLGAGELFKKKDGTPANIRYFMIFRNPVDKFVSGKLYSNRHNYINLETIVEKIKDEVNNARSHEKYYQGYSLYLITPFQKEFETRNMSVTSKTELMMNNLLKYDVVIGMVDRMPESLKILHHVLDSNKKITGLFEHFGMKDQEGNAKKAVLYNKSAISTLSVIAKLKKDEEFYQKLEEYVKYDRMLVEFALKLHLLQYDAIESG